MLPPGVTIRRWAPADAAPLDALYGDAFGAAAREGFARRRRWQYLDNPWAARPDLLVACGPSGELVGQTGGIPTPLQIGGLSVAAAWGADTVVHPDWRRRGIAGALVERWAVDGGHDLALGLGPAQAQQRMLQSHGYRVIGALVGLVRPGGMPSPPMASTGLTIAPLALDDPAVDAVWARVGPRREAGVIRDRRWLGWRYAACPSPTYDAFGAYRAGGLVGWVVLRTTPRMGGATLVVDWLYPADAPYVFDGMLSHAHRWGRARGADGMFAYATDARAIARLRAAGFDERPDFAVPVLVGGPAADALSWPPIGRWHLTLGDGDKDRRP